MAKYRKNTQCPICGQNTFKSSIYCGEFGVEESYYNCSNCGHNYSCVFGCSFEEDGKYSVAWDYNTPFYPLHKRLNKLRRIAKRNYKKYGKKTSDYTNRIGFFYSKNGIKKTEDVFSFI